MHQNNIIPQELINPINNFSTKLILKNGRAWIISSD